MAKSFHFWQTFSERPNLNDLVFKKAKWQPWSAYKRVGLYASIQSNLCITTTLGSQNLWPLLTGGRCTEVALCYENWNWDPKKWSLQTSGRYSEVVVNSCLTVDGNGCQIHFYFWVFEILRLFKITIKCHFIVMIASTYWSLCLCILL